MQKCMHSTQDAANIRPSNERVKAKWGGKAKFLAILPKILQESDNLKSC